MKPLKSLTYYLWWQPEIIYQNIAKFMLQNKPSFGLRVLYTFYCGNRVTRSYLSTKRYLSNVFFYAGTWQNILVLQVCMHIMVMIMFNLGTCWEYWIYICEWFFEFEHMHFDKWGKLITVAVKTQDSMIVHTFCCPVWSDGY